MLEITYAGVIIGIVSVGLTLLGTLVRHAVLDKDKLKEQKEKLKHHQEQMKAAQKNKDFKGMQTHQQQMMEVSMEQMRHNMKPMIFTLIPFMLVFGWMNANYNEMGNLHNVTITDTLAKDAQIASIQTSPHVNYTVSDGAIVWHLGNVTYPWSWDRFGYYSDGKWEVNVTGSGLTAKPQAALKAGYIAYYINSTTETFTNAPVEGEKSALKVSRTVPDVRGDVSSYTISYENLNTFYVVTILGVGLGWLRWYILCSFLSSIVFNKIFGFT